MSEIPSSARFLPIPQTRQIFRLGRTTLYALANKGEIEMRKVGRRTLVDVGTLEDFLARAPRVGRSAK